MHHKKKRKLFVHYDSIPIHKTLYSNIEKYLVSYSIPLSCMVVLLLGSILMINPNLSMMSKINAVTIQDEWVVTDNSGNNSSTSTNVDSDSPDEEFSGLAADDSDSPSTDNNDGIMPLAGPGSTEVSGSSSTSTLSLTLGSGNGGTISTSTVQGGKIAYASNTVTVSGSKVTDYKLTIKASSNNLTMPSGASSSTSTVSGITNGTIGDSFTANKWGYTYTDANTNESSYGSLKYNSLSTSEVTIDSGNTTSSNTVSLDKKLVFAAKFAEEAYPGTYSSGITLSAIATAATITMANLINMQDMTAQICNDSAVGQTATLKDNRGSSPISYKIIKMNDGTCWMAENLRLMNTTITSSDSDMTSGSFTIPASSISGWTSSDQNSAKAYYNSDTTYGAYYNWYTATAGAGASSISNGDVNTSICPKGWKLPAYDGTGSFYNIISGTNGYKSSWNSANKGYYFGNANAFWPAAGFVTDGSLIRAGSYGNYWSHRASSGSGAFYLDFRSSNVSPQDYVDRYLGFSVRCVAVAPTTYTINFLGNDYYYAEGTAPDPITCTDDSASSCTTTLPKATPTSVGWCSSREFLGWSTNSNATTPAFAAGQQITVTQDTTLYGVWTGGNTCGS